MVVNSISLSGSQNENQTQPIDDNSDNTILSDTEVGVETETRMGTTQNTGRGIDFTAVTNIADFFDNIRQQMDTIYEYNMNQENRMIQRAISLSNRTPQPTIKYLLDETHEGELETYKYDPSNDVICDDKVCPISQDIFQYGDDIINLPCNHRYLKSNILKWLYSESASCPICRYKLPCQETTVMQVPEQPDTTVENTESEYEDDEDEIPELIDSDEADEEEHGEYSNHSNHYTYEAYSDDEYQDQDQDQEPDIQDSSFSLYSYQNNHNEPQLLSESNYQSILQVPVSASINPSSLFNTIEEFLYNLNIHHHQEQNHSNHQGQSENQEGEECD